MMPVVNQPSIAPRLERPVRTSRGTILRFRADRASVSCVLAIFAVHAAAYWFLSPVGAALATIPLFLISIVVAPLNHHHQHVNVFRNSTLNRLYDLVLALQTGAGPYTWVLHHNLGHHLNYLTQPPGESPDESHWARSDGTVMGRLEYSFHLFFDHHRDIHRIGKSHPKVYRAYWMMRVPLYAILVDSPDPSAVEFPVRRRCSGCPHAASHVLGDVRTPRRATDHEPLRGHGESPPPRLQRPQLEPRLSHGASSAPGRSLVGASRAPQRKSVNASRNVRS